MNKSAIKGFAVRARRKLIEDITQKAYALGIKGTGKYEEIEEHEGGFKLVGSSQVDRFDDEDKKNRAKLIAEIEKKGFEQVVEEVAYTWFNRIIAIRFMEINEYLPIKVRFLSSEVEGKKEPDILTNIYDCVDELELDKDKVFNLKENHQDEELFKYVFVKECNKLGSLIPQVFEAISDYTELLLPDQLLASGSIIRDLVESIDEEDFRHQVEIIGWLYQYYNEEKKNEVININKSLIKKNDIPAATQLFTTKWVVKYMVDNTLGRYWLERNPTSALNEKLEFFICNNIEHINENIKPEDIKFLDPCMGSGHILVYAFELLMHIYEERGYRTRDAARLILENNLFGLDIDDRAGQLASFSLMMSARKYDRRIFSKNVHPQTYSIQESDNLTSFQDGAGKIEIPRDHMETANYLINTFRNAKEYGSIVRVEGHEYDKLLQFIHELKQYESHDLFTMHWLSNVSKILPSLVNQAQVMARKYDVVVTNPPYLNKLNSSLKEYLKKDYKKFSKDLFSVFIVRNFEYCKQNGYSALMTPFVWMFIKTYEELREYIIKNKKISSLIQMEYSAFEEATVPICSFVFQNCTNTTDGFYIKLSDFKGGMDVQEKKVLEALSTSKCNYVYEKNESDYLRIPGFPIAYWLTDRAIDNFDNNPSLKDFSEAKSGMSSCDSQRFLRRWYEVEIPKIERNAINIDDVDDNNAKWYPYNKGGGNRKWYGYNDVMINWENNGSDIKHFVVNNPKDPNTTHWSRRLFNLEYFFQNGISWSAVTSGRFSCRCVPKGIIPGTGSKTLYGLSSSNEKFTLALLNSKVASYYLNLFSPTLNFEAGDVGKVPILLNARSEELFVDELIELSYHDWNSMETSLDFQINPLVGVLSDKGLIKDKYEILNKNHENMITRMKEMEEHNNNLLIDWYGMKDLLDSQVLLKDISLSCNIHYKYGNDRDVNEMNELKRLDTIKELISYAVGCMFGRYSIDEKGLIFAGGQFDLSKYSTYRPVGDNLLLISEEDYFDNDLLSRFIEFISAVFGEDTLEENLKYIAYVLNSKSKGTPRQTIRTYFVKDFYKDHCKLYKKRPIYWLIDSGKQNGVKALLYMHRYDKSTVARFRTDYLHEIQRYYENDIELTQKTNDKKRVDKLKKKLQEITEFDKVVAHIAHQQVEIDLDDGVEHNYEVFQGIELPQGDGQKPLKANLLAKRK